MKTFKQLREEVWDQPSPNKNSREMTPKQKAEAKRRAKSAGRPYPNLVDNMAAIKEEACCGECLDEIVETEFYSDGFEQYEDWGEPSEYGLAIHEEDGVKVKLGKPFLTPDGPKKRAVYVKNDKGNVVKVSFGDKNLEIKRDDPERRKAYRARHGCDNPGPRWKANYWSCKFWSKTPVSEL